MPPRGNEKSLLSELYLSGDPPFSRHVLWLFELLELAIVPLLTALEGSTFISESFLIFFSWT